MKLRLAIICTAALWLLPAPPPAAAAGHPLLTTIAVGYPQAEPLKDACGVAVDPAGRIFVANYYEHAVYVFEVINGEHKYKLRIPIEEPPFAPSGKPAGGPCDLAIDSGGNLYVNNWHYDVVRLPRLNASTPSYGPGVVIDSNQPTGVSVDPANDHVFVDDRTYVAEYDSS